MQVSVDQTRNLDFPVWNALTEMRWPDKNWPDIFGSFWLKVSCNDYWCFLLANFSWVYISPPLCRISWMYVIWLVLCELPLLMLGSHWCFLPWYHCVPGTGIYSEFMIVAFWVKFWKETKTFTVFSDQLWDIEQFFLFMGCLIIWIPSNMFNFSYIANQLIL